MAFHRRLLSSHEDSGNSSSHGGSYIFSYSYCVNSSCPSPPAPAPSLAPPFNNSSTGVAESPIGIDLPIPHGTPHIKTFILIIAVVLATCFLLLTYYAVLLRYRTLRRQRSLRPAAVNDHQNPPPPEGDGGLLLAADEIHHVWYIRTVGLDENTIGSITVCPYKGGDGLIESTDCSVCLSEFHDGELVRLLPKCSHAFHIACIDTWLRSHVNCPLCRAPIVAPPPTALQQPQPATTETALTTAVVDSVELGPSSTNAASSSSSSSSSSVGDNSRLMLPYDDASRLVIPESSGGADDAREPGIEIPVSSLPPPPPNSEIGFRVRSDLGGSVGRQADHSNEWVTIDLGEGQGDGGIQPIRRSFSMDALAISALFRGTESESSSSCHDRKDSSLIGAGVISTIREKQGNGLKGSSSPHRSPSDLTMNRSLSSNSGRFFLSRFARGRGNTILPI